MNKLLLLPLGFFLILILPNLSSAYSKFVTQNTIVTGSNTGGITVGSASYNSFYFAWGGSEGVASGAPTVAYTTYAPTGNQLNIQTFTGTLKGANATAAGNSATDSLTFKYSLTETSMAESGVGLASSLSTSNIVGFDSNGVNAGGNLWLTFTVPVTNDEVYILGGGSAHFGSTTLNAPTGCATANSETTSGSYAFVDNCILAAGTYTANFIGSGTHQTASIAAFIFNSGGTSSPVSGVSLISSNQIIDNDQVENVIYTISPGVANYGYTFMIENTITNNVITINTLAPSSATTANFLFSIPNVATYANAIGVVNVIANVVDSASTTNAMTNTITIYPAFGGLSLISSNQIADRGQSELLTYQTMGGAPNYGYTIQLVNSINGNVIAVGSGSQSSNVYTLSFAIPTTNPNAIGVANIIANAVDSATTYESNVFTNTITIYPAPTTNLFFSNIGGNTVGSGVTAIANDIFSGGTGTFSSVNTINNVNAPFTVLSPTQISNAYVAIGTATYVYNILVTDTGTTHPYALPLESNYLVASLSTFVVGSVTPPQPIIAAAGSVNLYANPSGGTIPYTYQWWTGTNSICNGAGNNYIAGAVANVYDAMPSLSQYFCYFVQDSNTPPNNGYSPVDLVGVDGFCINGLCSSSFNFVGVNGVNVGTSGINTIIFSANVASPITNSSNEIACPTCGSGGGANYYTFTNGLTETPPNVVTLSPDITINSVTANFVFAKVAANAPIFNGNVAAPSSVNAIWLNANVNAFNIIASNAVIAPSLYANVFGAWAKLTTNAVVAGIVLPYSINSPIIQTLGNEIGINSGSYVASVNSLTGAITYNPLPYSFTAPLSASGASVSFLNNAPLTTNAGGFESLAYNTANMFVSGGQLNIFNLSASYTPPFGGYTFDYPLERVGSTVNILYANSATSPTGNMFLNTGNALDSIMGTGGGGANYYTFLPPFNVVSGNQVGLATNSYFSVINSALNIRVGANTFISSQNTLDAIQGSGTFSCASLAAGAGISIGASIPCLITNTGGGGGTTYTFVKPLTANAANYVSFLNNAPITTNAAGYETLNVATIVSGPPGNTFITANGLLDVLELGGVSVTGDSGEMAFILLAVGFLIVFQKEHYGFAWLGFILIMVIALFFGLAIT